MSEWKEFLLNEVATITDCEHKTAPLVKASEFISVRTSNISNGKIDYANCNRVSKETYDLWTQRMVPQGGDIILAREAPVGEVGFIHPDRKICLGQRTVLVRVNQNLINNKFLLYYLANRDTKFELVSRSTGSVVEHLNVKDIREFNIKVPNNLSEQSAIAEVLSSLDDKIDLLQCQNKTLEQLAETLFRQWFIEDGQKNDFVELAEYVETINGVSYKSSELNPSTTAMVSLKSFDRNGGFRIDGFKEFTGKYKDKQVVVEGDLIVAHTDITQEAEVIGNPALVFGNPKYDTLVISMDIVKVVPKVEWISIEFLYYLMKTREFKGHCEGNANGSTVLHLSKQAIPRFEFPKPEKSRAIEFTIQAKELTRKIFNNHNQIRNLTQLRDTLLPKLMSGEVRLN